MQTDKAAVMISPTKPQQYRALGLSTLTFTLCFAVWTIFSIIGIRIAEDLGLSDTQLGLLMATPILTGSISRLFLGIWTDRYGGRWVLGILMLTTAACVYLLTYATTYLLRSEERRVGKECRSRGAQCR